MDVAVCAALSHPGPDNMRAALQLAVNHSGDSDSAGAICGNILGALHGTLALPADFAAVVEARELIVATARALAAAITG